MNNLHIDNFIIVQNESNEEAFEDKGKYCNILFWAKTWNSKYNYISYIKSNCYRFQSHQFYPQRKVKITIMKKVNILLSMTKLTNINIVHNIFISTKNFLFCYFNYEEKDTLMDLKIIGNKRKSSENGGKYWKKKFVTYW